MIRRLGRPKKTPTAAVISPASKVIEIMSRPGNAVISLYVA